ncbi:glycosyltransferase [Rhodopila sp.]|uniref:glycosyltransferase n=1 Tax=Rhodopila sp. TaxID=2480087 RepID=UPI003D122160
MANNTVVAIPARDEAERIESCLIALDKQILRPDLVVLLLNNCSDATEPIAWAMAPNLHFDLQIISRDLPLAEANAGHARRLVMAAAAVRAGSDGVLLTTDADATVPVDWVSRAVGGLAEGADVVCGRAVIDPLEATLIPAHLHQDDALECRLIALLDDLAWMLDPEPHDPPPRHTEASGASLAVGVAAFHRVGGIPPIAAGEDRAFVRALWMMDARLRHDPAIQVTVSGRVVGRAEGGMADAIRRRMVRQDEFTDDQVEPAGDAFRRYRLRRRVRRAWARTGDARTGDARTGDARTGDARTVDARATDRGVKDDALAGDMALSPRSLLDALAMGRFGAAWARLEAVSPLLRRRRVRFGDLGIEITAAEALLKSLLPPELLAAD